MTTKIRLVGLYTVILASGFFSCEKYLAQKPSVTLAVPSSLSDLQAILDNHFQMNMLSPELVEIPSDDYYALTADYQSSLPSDQSSYIWSSIAGSNDDGSWVSPYLTIYNSNVVLDQLPTITLGSGDADTYNNIKGSALVYRAFNFYELAQVYCRPYSSSAATDLGIALRLTAAIETKSTRATVQQTYDQIIGDLKTAAGILPVKALYPTRPNKAAAYGLLARTYLSMRDYTNAGVYADSALKQYDSLMDYNTLSPGYIPRFNKETIFYNIVQYHSYLIYPTSGRIDSTLYQLYSPNDLRKSVFFLSNGDGTFNFSGSYDGDYYPSIVFTGITTDEMYLIRAESEARAGDKDDAMADLNTLLQTRWVTSTFVPYTATTAADALSQILVERRKELVFRGLRWPDIRRLNLEGANITLTRVINGMTYTLPPNDLRSVMLIPSDVVSISSLPQNPR